ncbi:polymorphic toxin-type HINT domain-containing protein [Actinoplanes sp. DH11]|uniref:polymorphic toxin-type HINT domain-containing protein n=1 Tax=Actinoplanes sp. DH11 TaxID=2857011 RepID=UPI001E4CB40B|nr:polymorphic toxin-type HINT domain-containing protein [Actinoplanes sp. DH11]
MHLSPAVEKLDNDGREVRGIPRPVAPLPEAQVPAPVWPAAGSKVATSPAGVSRSQRTAAAATTVTATVVDRQSVPQRWRGGVVAEVEASTPTTASVTMDYAAFKYAYGGDWASRLKLWHLPGCALTTPDKAGCDATALPSRNDLSARTVTAEVPVTKSPTAGATALVALAAAPSGSGGDFSATPLSASSSWSAGGSTGDFNWTYPMRTPSGINGPQPSLSLSYSSSGVDGRSSATNNQPSWLGEGFEFSPGYIERRYVSCDEDTAGDDNNPAHSVDQCWRTDNAFLSFSGASSELIHEEGKGWHPLSENGSKVERLPGAGNDDANGEHWKVTTPDGTQYFFGRNSLPGQSSKTNSAWTLPVYSNHAGEPGHADTFSASRHTRAWRWNLDYVIDTNGNTLSYWYDTEENQYAAEGDESKNLPYVRGGTLSRIDYGTWERGADRSVTARAQVLFTTGDRCDSDCGTHDGKHWPDTPWDQECKLTATSCDNFSPTFWSTKRLAKVTTRIWDTRVSPAKWQDVDSYTLKHDFPPPEEGHQGGLWLSSIVHTGHAGGTITMPEVTLEPKPMANRVLTMNSAANYWNRLERIQTETGAVTQVHYSSTDCSAGNLPASPQNNTRLCYPVLGPDPDNPTGAPKVEWWHKYVVRMVSQTDVQIEGNHQSPTVNTHYTYEGTPAWHYADDDGLSKPKYKTWNQFRGYRTVATRVGDSNQTLTRTTYLRGMHGDRAGPSGGTRDVTVPASLGTETVYDEDQFAGMVREQTVYNGVDTHPVSTTVNVPWRSGAKATRTVNGDTATARYVNTRTTYTGTALGAGASRGWRVTSIENTFDEYGLLSEVQNNGDHAAGGDEKCTTTTYNRNTDKNLIALPSRVTTTALPCGTAPTAPEHVVDDALTFYDGATSAGTAPAKGNLTRTDLLNGWTAAGGTAWRTSGKATFDDFGRQETETDARGNTVTTKYLPATSLVTQKTQTTNLGWETTTDINPAWAAPTKIKDHNNRITEVTYDALGRTAAVWDPGWKRVLETTPPSTRFTYVFDAGRGSYPYVKTEKLNAAGGTDVSYAIYDGLLRPRQSQSAAVKGGADNGAGRVVTDTHYDAWGRAYMAFGAHTEPGAPSGTLWWEPEWSVFKQDVSVFDRAGRIVESIFRAGDGVTNLVDKWRTTTTYEGDRITVVPPKGGTPTTTITDALGRTSELRQYTTAAGIGGAHQSTWYEHNAKDQLTKVTDHLKNEWAYTYDILGRQIQAVDPDSGTTKNEYDQFGDLIKTTDGRGEVLAYDYDDLGRKLAVYDDSVVAANKRAEWKYDTLANGTVSRGSLTQSIRYDIAADGTRQPYKWQALLINSRNQVTGDQWNIPPNETGLGGTYVYSHGFSSYNGSPTTLAYPAGGGQVTETVTTKYGADHGLPTGMETNLPNVNTYVTAQTYTGFGEPSTTQMWTSGGEYTEQSFDYETDTRRLKNVQVKPSKAAGNVVNRTYSYQPSGNIESITDAPKVGQADKQCFAYDGLSRLASAWTPASTASCGTAPTVATLAGPAPYWIDWTVNEIGNRTSETTHTAAGDTVRTYTSPASGKGSVRPHAVTSMTTKLAGQTTSTASNYTYDLGGNTKTRPGQTLTWDSEGRLAKVVEGTKTTTNLYDADGTRLIRRDSTGTTLYLPGMELRRTVSGTTSSVAGIRYYSFNGAVIASRTTAVNGLTWLFTDHQGTQQTAVNAASQQVTSRRQTPYGGVRGTNAAWPNPKGFVGGDTEPTGLTHIGARQYDNVLGRFISVDPIQDLTDPQQWNAYAYANNSPITMSDPTGLRGDDLFYGPTGAQQMEQPGVTGGTSNIPDTGGSPNGGGGNGGGNGGGGGGGGASGGGGGGGGAQAVHAPPKKEGFWQRASRWGSQNLNNIIGVGVGIATFTTCTALTAGAGTLGCMAVAGAAGTMTTDYLDGNIHSANDLAKSAIVGGITGVLGVPLAAADMVTQSQAVVDNIKEGDYLEAAGHGALGALDAVSVVAGGRGFAKASCKGHSFVPGTLVLMGDGTTKPIEDIEVGDQVTATDPETGKTRAEPVTELHNNLDEKFVDLTVTLPSGASAVVQTTHNHPFWDRTTRQWTDADSLKTGHQLQTTESAPVTVAGKRTFTGSQWMRDLTVANVHTYYVLAGTTPVLVHNCGGIVYRALAKGEDPSVGLFARDPAAVGVSPLSHVAGKKATPWISTTKSRSVAFDKYDQGYGVVAIDTRMAMRVEDISNGPFPSSRRHSSYARKDQEVLIFQNVPPEAIVGHWPGR